MAEQLRKLTAWPDRWADAVLTCG